FGAAPWERGPSGHGGPTAPDGAVPRRQEATMETKNWTIDIQITEDDTDSNTLARAVLTSPDGKRHESVGLARRNPSDRPVPQIGDELAAGRALMALADKLIGEAAEDVAQFSGTAH